MLGHEVEEERGDIFGSFAQGRHMDRVFVEPMEEVEPEVAGDRSRAHDMDGCQAGFA
jgi:hypothetical protein